MSKWADLCISGANKNDEETHIVSVWAKEDLGKKMSKGQVFSRQEIIKAIESGSAVITIRRNDDGKWVRGERVIVVVINEVKYIKTVANEDECDNLGSLPTFARS